MDPTRILPLGLQKLEPPLSINLFIYLEGRYVASANRYHILPRQ